MVERECEHWENYISSPELKIAHCILWTRITRDRLDNIGKWSRGILVDFPQCSEFVRLVDAIAKQVSIIESTAFKQWSEYYMKLIDAKSPLLVPQQSSKILELDPVDGKLIVNFGDKLDALSKEVRVLSSYGMKIPKQILAAVSDSSRLIPYSVLLKQIANFYNTIDAQIIPSQRPLLLDNALEFENIVKNQSGLNSFSGLERAVNSLRESSEKLVMLNGNLRQAHELVLSRMLTLLDTDLVRNAAKWKDLLANIRQIVINVQVQGSYDNSRMVTWVNHLDAQLLKILQIKWTNGLRELTKEQFLENYEVELILKAGVLQLKPTPEELRSKIYRDIKRYISIPSLFRGVHISQNSLPFEKLISKHAVLIAQIYGRIEKAIASVVKSLADYEQWAAFASVSDVESVLLATLKTAENWEHNFKFVKTALKDVDSLANSASFDFVSLQIKTFKLQVETVLDNWFQALASSLRKSINAEVAMPEQFMISGAEIIGKKATSIEQIGELNRTFAALEEQKSVITAVLAEVTYKYTLMKQVVSSAPVLDIPLLLTRWDKFCMVLGGHKLLIDEQTASLKEGLTLNMGRFQSSFDGLVASWNELQPRDNQLHDELYMENTLKVVNVVSGKFDDLMHEYADIEKQCDFFAVECSVKATAENYRRYVAPILAVWETYRIFQEDYEKVFAQEWILVRSNILPLQEFQERWRSKMSQVTKKSGVEQFIIRRLDLVKAFLEISKCVRGDSWSSEHWAEFFEMISIDHAVKSSTLKCIHLVNVAPTVLEKLPAIEALNQRARSESKVGEALNEVEAWAAVSQFSLTSYEKSPGLNIITGWTDIISQIGDQISLLQNIRGSSSVGPFKDRLDIWDNRLSELDSCIQIFVVVQRKFLYLHPVFTSDSGSSLVAEVGNFKRSETLFLRYFEENLLRCTSDITISSA
eukprot:Partr_v1_DN29033_c0_g2_i2_m58543 putative dynein cytoplasmic 2 heavy chain 1